MEFLSDDKIDKYLKKEILNELNNHVDQYLLKKYNSFIPLIHYYYYEIMDFFSERISDTNRQNIVHKHKIVSVSNIEQLYIYLREEFDNIFKELYRVQPNLKSIRTQIILDPKIHDKLDFLTNDESGFLTNSFYKNKIQKLVDETISEMVSKFCKWVLLVNVNLPAIYDYSDTQMNDDNIIILSYLQDVMDSLNIKNYNFKKCVQNKSRDLSISSKIIPGNMSDIPMVTEVQTIPFGSNTNLHVAESHSIPNSSLLREKFFLVHPNHKTKPISISGGKKSKKKRSRKKSKKNNTRKTNKHISREYIKS